MNAPGLLALPWHLRHAVWSLIVPRAVHVFDREGRLALSACYPSQVREPDGSECTRRVGSDEGFNFQDRQESQWALHWTCEEQRDKGLGRDVEALMMSCKPIFRDIIQTLTQTQVHVASLDTLKMLVLSPTQVGDDRQRKRRQTSLELPSVLEGARMPRQLYIILKVSHAFCVAMQDVEATAASSPNDTGEDQYQKDLLNSWRRIGEILSGLLGLARVDVWIDHRSIEMWATFNERAIAKPITQFASKHGDEVSTIKQLADAERLLIKRGVDVKAGRALFEDFMNQDAPEEYRDPDMPEPRYRFPGSDIWNQFFNRHNRYMERVYGQSECVYEQPECSFEEYWQGQVRKRQTKQDGVETARNEASR